LAGLTPEQVEAELLVSSEGEADTGAGAEWNRSTARRELRFLLSHTIHHYALIALSLGTRGFEIPEALSGFGVAPSTLRHRKQVDSPSSG
jgi:hypothetical protein